MKNHNSAYENSLNTPVYFLVSATQKDGYGEDFVKFFATQDEAIKAAKLDWNHLTRFEQNKQTVQAWSVTQDSIQPDLVDDNRPWWEATADRNDLLVEFK